MHRVRNVAPGAGLSLVLLTSSLTLLAVPSFVLPIHSSSAAPIAPTRGSFTAFSAPASAGASASPALAPAAASIALAEGGASPSAIDLTWGSASGIVTGYTVEVSTAGADGPWSTAASPGTTASAVITDLTPGGAYWWEIDATRFLAGDQYSNILSETQPSLAYLNVTQPTSATAVLNWTDNASYGGTIGYESFSIVEKIASGAWATVATIRDLATRTANVSGLLSSTSYAFYLNTTDCTAGCGTATPTEVTTESNVVTAGTPGPLLVTIGVERSVVDVGQADYFLCTPSGGRSPYSFAWRFSLLQGFSAGPSARSDTFGSAGSPTITCQVTDAGASQANDSQTVLVNPAPILNVTINRTAADAGQLIEFGCQASGGTEPLTLGWSFGDGSESLTANSTHSYGSAGDFPAACSLVDGAGDSVLNTTAIVIDPPPVAVLTISAPAAAPNTTLEFSVSFLNGSEPFGGVGFSFGDGSTAGGPTDSHAYHLTGNYTVAGRGKDANGVFVRSTAVVHIVPLLLALSLPTASLTRGTSYGFGATATGGAGGPFTVTWGFGDGTASVAGGSVSHKFPNAGHFVVAVRATDRLGAVIVRNVTVSVSAPVVAPSIFSDPWLLLLPAAAVGATVDLYALRRYRAAEFRSTSGSAQYVLPTDPERTLSGVRKCRNCGTSNSAVRESCAMCGAPLPRSIFG